MKPKKILGQKSWKLKSSTIKAYVTRQGGQLGPVVFDRKDRKIKPYHVAPWAREDIGDQPEIIKALRGDFFCLPFGGNATSYKGEDHPIHGETANARWSFESLTSGDGETVLHLSMETTIRPGHVDKRIRLVDGHDAIYSQHVISDMKGPMTMGHHAMLRFPDREGAGRISTSPVKHGQVFVQPSEDPAEGGYSMLQPGAIFSKLSSVPTITRHRTDLSRYPARRGFEEIAILVSEPETPLAWTAVAFPQEGYAWYALKDQRILTSTLLWLSNGGRHYAPWNSRHVNVMGLEEITGFFHVGLAESARQNELSDLGVKTAHILRRDRPLTVNYIMGVVPIDEEFDEVASIEASDNGLLLLTSKSGQQAATPCDLDFLQS